jgi:hypothetical protein
VGSSGGTANGVMRQARSWTCASSKAASAFSFLRSRQAPEEPSVHVGIAGFAAIDRRNGRNSAVFRSRRRPCCCVFQAKNTCAFSHSANFCVSVNIASATTGARRTNSRHIFANTALFTMAAMAFASRFPPYTAAKWPYRMRDVVRIECDQFQHETGDF